MTELFSTMKDGIVAFVETIPSAIKDIFMNLIYVDPDASTLVVSNFAKFGFGMLGLSLGIGLTKWVVSLIRRKI